MFGSWACEQAVLADVVAGQPGWALLQSLNRTVKATAWSRWWQAGQVRYYKGAQEPLNKPEHRPPVPRTGFMPTAASHTVALSRPDSGVTPAKLQRGWEVG